MHVQTWEGNDPNEGLISDMVFKLMPTLHPIFTVLSYPTEEVHFTVYCLNLRSFSRPCTDTFIMEPRFFLKVSRAVSLASSHAYMSR